MPREAAVVIGAHYGDEGKGALTDRLVAEAGPDALVIRFNGGAQAGHTVALPDGTRHVFSHFGAGTLAGASTWLSRHFVSNPILFLRERAELRAKGVAQPRMLADPAGVVTTPWDMMVNTMVEDARGAGRHGSVGVGFGETLERGLKPDLAITIGDLQRGRDLRPVLERIRRDWVPARLAALGFPGLEARHAGTILSDGLVERWLADAAAFAVEVEPRGAEAVREARLAVFEGAQGLLLDQNIGRALGQWPHVTRSSTGLKNVGEIAAAAGIEALDVVWATRSYVTRHGAGPLAGELDGPPWDGIRDDTNLPHAYQGRLRFSLLDTGRLAAAIHADLASSGSTAQLVRGRTLAVSCLDQLGGAGCWTESGARRSGSPEALAEAACRAMGANGLLGGWGQERSGMEPLRSAFPGDPIPHRAITP